MTGLDGTGEQAIQPNPALSGGVLQGLHHGLQPYGVPKVGLPGPVVPEPLGAGVVQALAKHRHRARGLGLHAGSSQRIRNIETHCPGQSVRTGRIQKAPGLITSSLSDEEGLQTE